MIKKDIIKNKIKIYYIPFILLLSLSIFMNSQCHIQGGDDTVFVNSFTQYGGILGWLKSYTSIWSGRIVPHFILIVLLNCNIIIWKILNSLMITSLAIAIFKFTVNEKTNLNDSDKTKIAYFICSIILFLPASVVSSSILWVTGSFTYLWSTVFAIVVLIPFKKLLMNEKVSKKILIISFISILYASYVEQSAALIIAFSVICIIIALICKIKVKWYNYVMFLFIAINSYISLSAVGNSVRNEAETLCWYPDFDMLSFIDKVFLGVSETFNNIYTNCNYLMIILGILIVILVARKNTDKCTKLLSLIPLIYPTLKLLSVDKLFSFMDTDKVFITRDYSQYLPIICALTTTLITIYLFFVLYDNYKEAIITTLVFGASICESIIMGISPTIFASGSRIFFVTDLLIILCIIRLFYYLYEIEYDKMKNNKLLIIIPCIIAIILCINYTLVIAPKSYF